jgi:DNA-binding MurR/RpiR family transcriptional regulator
MLLPLNTAPPGVRVRKAEAAMAARVAAEREMKLDARRNRSINTAISDSQRANKIAADVEAEVRAWEQALETDRCVQCISVISLAPCIIFVCSRQSSTVCFNGIRYL